MTNIERWKRIPTWDSWAWQILLVKRESCSLTGTK